MLSAPARPALTSLPFVAFFPPSSFAINLLLQLPEPVQVCLAPQPHGPAITDAQHGGLNLGGHNPAVQGHNRNTRCFGRLVRVKGLYHYVIYITHLSKHCKTLILWMVGCKHQLGAPWCPPSMRAVVGPERRICEGNDSQPRCIWLIKYPGTLSPCPRRRGWIVARKPTPVVQSCWNSACKSVSNNSER